jgi:ribosomal protein S18 acetylase RimI-like enzyme
MLVRKLDAGDAAALQACRLFGLEESPEAYLATLAEVQGSPLSNLEADLRNDDIHYLGAFDGGEMIGFMRYLRDPRVSRRHVAEVRSVYVRGSARGRKVGSALLRQLIEDARSAGIESLILAVLADNLSARRLYEACGFLLYGTEPGAIRKAGGDIDQALYRLGLGAD